MQAGRAGRAQGRVLAQGEDWWADSDFAAGEGALRDQLKALVDQGPP